MQKRTQPRPGVRRRRRMSYNGKTLLWLLLFFPVGLARMLRWRCSWPTAVKCAVCALPVLLLLGIMLYPDPTATTIGGVTLYGDDRSTKIYGPDVPMNYVLPLETAVPGSIVASEESLADTRFFVYANDNGKCYHMDHCDYTSDTAKKLTVYEAYYSGYQPCDVCNSPAYTGVIE